MTDAGDRWIVPLEGAVIDACCFDFGVALRITHDDHLWELRVEQPFVVAAAGREYLVVPDGDPARFAPVLRCLRQTVGEVVAFKDAALEVRCSDGTCIRVPASEGFEAWTLVGPAGVRLISVPGGELAIWDSATEEP